MLRVALLLGLVALAAALPPVSRSRADVEAFKNFLESTRKDNGLYSERLAMNPKANAEELSGKFEGDIVLDDFQIDAMVKQFAEGRNAYIVPNTKWPENTVVWDYGDNLYSEAHRAALEAGIRDIESRSCIRFRRRQGESNYVSVTAGTGGCFANVGYWATRGLHVYNLQLSAPGVSCFRHGTIVHEWLHILGFFHMQSTYNRDDYVRIATENIIPSTLGNFNIYNANQVSNLGVEYDYVSAMHYGPFAFTSNGLQTIIPLREHEGEMGQREYITDSDWLRLNRHYDCPGAWN